MPPRWPACRSGRWRSTTKSASTCRGRSFRRPRTISAPTPSIRPRRSSSKRWWSGTAGSAARTARASTTTRRTGRRACGLAWRRSSASSSIPTRSASRTSRTDTCSRWRSRRRAACSKASSPIRARPMSARSWASATRPIRAAPFRSSTAWGSRPSSPGPRRWRRNTGPEFEPGDKLTAMAERGETFYGIYGEKQKAA